MDLHKAVTGERYCDDSGWSRLVSIDRQRSELIIELDGGSLIANAENIEWLISALTTVRDATHPKD